MKDTIARMSGYMRGLIEPDDSVTEKAARDKARLITALLLVVQVVLFIIFPIRYILFMDNRDEIIVRLIISLWSGVFIHIMYRLARRGRHEGVAWGVGILGTGIILATALALGREGIATLYYPTIITLFISLFFSQRSALFLILLQLSGTLLVGLISPDLALTDVLMGPFSFTVVMSFLIILFTVFREMIEHTRSQQLKENEERLHAAIQGSLDPFYMVEPRYDEHGIVRDFLIVDMNSPARKQAGYSRSQLIGKGMLEVFPNLRKIYMIEKYRQVLQSGTALEEEFMLPLERGFEWYYHQIVPVGSGLAIINRDITEEKSNARAMEQLNKELITLYETATAFASTLDLTEIYRIIYRELAYKLYNVNTFSISDYDANEGIFTRRFVMRDGVETLDESGTVRKNTGKYAAVEQRRPVVGVGGRVRTPMDTHNGTRPAYEMGFTVEELLEEKTNVAATSLRDNTSELHIPLFSNNQPIGVISLYHDSQDHFFESDMAMLMTIAGQAASAISNARMYAQAQQELIERKTIEDALRKSEEILRENEKNFRLLAENSPDTIYIMSMPEWKLEYFNSDTFLGYTEEEIRKSGSLTRNIHEDDKPRLMAYWAELLKGAFRGNGFIEYRLKNAQDEWEWVQSREVIMQRHPDGTPSRLMVALTVITERKRSEEILRQSEEKFRLLAENSPDTIYILSLPDLGLEYINRDKIVGHDASIMYSSPGLRPFMHPDDLAALAEHRHNVLQNRIDPSSHIEYRVLNAKGEWEWVQSRVSTMQHDEKGFPMRAIVTLTVITERKKAEAALRESEEKFRSIAEISPDTIYILSVPERELLYINRDDINGHSLDDLGRGGLEPHIHPDDLARLTRERAELFDGSESEYMTQSEYRLRNPQGEWVWVQSRVVVMEKRADGTPSKVMVALTDITERKQSEAALRQSEERYRAVISGQTELVSRYKPDLTLTFVNDAYSRFFGGSFDELVGRNIADFIPEEDLKAAQDHVREVMKSDQPLIHVHRTLTPEGSIRWFQWTDNAIRDDNGEIVEIQATGLDITERLMAEEALRTSEAHNRAIVSAMPDLIFIINQDGVFEDTLVSDESRLLMPPTEFIGKSVLDVMPPGVGERALPMIKEVLHSRKLQTLEYHIDLPETREYYEARIIVYEQDKVLVFVRDITERKKAEEALRRSEEVLRQITENIDEIFFIVDQLTDKIVYMSPAYEDIFGLKREILETHPGDYRRVIHPDDIEMYDAQIKQMDTEGKQLNFEYRIIRASDGKVRWLWLRTFFIRADDGGIWRVVGIVEDITERRMIEAQVLEVTRERERQQLLRSLISDITHDLMTPITVMRTGLHLIRNPEPQEKKLERVGRLEEQVSHLQEMLQDMFTMSKLEGPVNEEFNFIEEDISGFLGYFVDTMEPLAQTRGYQLTADLCERNPVIRFDRGKLQRALTNLVDNAMKYTPQGTHIHLHSYCDQTGTVIVVQDDGPGIRSDALPRIFDRFYRVEDHRPDTSGTGLGLAITRKIIEAHGGHIDVESEVGKGTRFTIWLPRVNGKE